MARRRDLLVDKKIGSVICMQRVKLKMSQSELGDALGVSFQQIQKHEQGTVASTRIADLSRALEMTPNDLFGVSSKIDGDVSKLTSWAMTVALKLQDASPAVVALILKTWRARDWLTSNYPRDASATVRTRIRH